MATSGTYDFSLDIDEVIEEAMEMIGGEQTLGHEPKSARRSINLLLQDWQNRGILLWTADTTTVSVSTSVTAYSLPDSTIDVVEALEKGYVVNKGVTNIKQKTTVLNSRDLAIKFYDIDEDSYIVSDYTDDLFRLVYNENSLGLFNKKTGVLVQLRRRTILDISKYLSRPLK